MDPQSRLRTPRLVLVPIDPELARRVVGGRLEGILASPGWPHEDTIEALAVAAEQGEDAPPGWLVVRALDREVIGDCGWHAWPDGEGVVEIGYGLAESVRGVGYGTELVRAMVEWTTSQPGVHRVVARTLPGNVASQRLLRRLGFREDADAPGTFARPLA